MIQQIINNVTKYNIVQRFSIITWFILRQFKIGHWNTFVMRSRNFMKYLTSSIFIMAIISGSMSIFADKYGINFSFQLESIGNFISFLFLYFGNNLYYIFSGVIINASFSYLHYTCTLYIYEYFSRDYITILNITHNLSHQSCITMISWLKR